jgi:dihydropyrimidinase
VPTLVRGTRVWDGGEVRGRPGFGRFLPCGRPDMARPKVVDPVDGGHYVANRPDALGRLAQRHDG